MLTFSLKFEPKVTKSNALIMDIDTFACHLNQKQTGGNPIDFSTVLLIVSKKQLTYREKKCQ